MDTSKTNTVVIKMEKNIHYVDNSYNAIATRHFFTQIAEVYKTGVLCEELEDLIEIVILKNYNPDGSDRMIINPL